MTAALARTRPEVDHMRGAPDGVFIVFKHQPRVALGLEFRQRIEQDAVVARMQTDGRFIEDVADAAQVGAELRGEPDTLRFATRQGRCGTIEREITESDPIEEVES